MRAVVLERRTPLRARRELRRTVALRRTAPAPGTDTTRRQPRTGFPPKVRRSILARDGNACVCCGITREQAPLTVHHRINRGMGGDPTVSTVVHGIACCWPCNGLMETSPTRATEARRNGWKVKRGQDPAKVRVVYPDGRRWLLLPDGTRRVA